MDRIETAAEQAGLRAVAVERDAERENLAGADQAGGFDDVLGAHVVERADLVVFPQRPQFLSFSVGSAIACLPTLMSIACSFSFLFAIRLVVQRPDCDPARNLRPRQALDATERAQDPSRSERHVGERRGAERAERIADGVHDRAGRAEPASPAPLAPSSGSAVGVTTWPTSMSGISAAIGTR